MRDFARFLDVTAGSASKIENHLLLSHDLGLVEPRGYEELQERTTEVKRTLTALNRCLRADC
jgi:four helix bundle protein